MRLINVLMEIRPPVRPMDVMKKRKKTKKETYCSNLYAYSPRPPTLVDHDQILLSFELRRNRLRDFEGLGIEITSPLTSACTSLCYCINRDCIRSCFFRRTSVNDNSSLCAETVRRHYVQRV